MTIQTNTHPRVQVGPQSARPISPTEDGLIYVSESEVSAWNAQTSSWISSAGLSPSDHETLRQLIHLADGVGGPMNGWPSGAYRETLPAASAFPTAIIWWTDSTKTKKILQKDIVFGAFPVPQTVKWTVFAADGTTAIEGILDTMTYSGLFELSRTRTTF